MASRTVTIVLGFALAATVGMVFFAPVVEAVNTNTGTQSVTNQTVSADVGSYVDLGGYDINTNSETVWMFNDSSGNYEQATSGTDYEMAYQNGSIKALSGSSHIDDGETVKVSYDYQASGELTSLVVGFIPVGFATLIFAKLAFGTTENL